jgi:uncharacterized membrane protein YphA (DoxX/SURF4 family)
MGACSGTIADIIGADVAIVVATGGTVRGIAVICGFVTRVVALSPAATGVSGMNRATPYAAGIGAVAV